MTLPPPPRQNRRADELRFIQLQRHAVRSAEGSCLVTFGETRVLCAVSVEDGVPGWRRGSGLGWLTAEYSMLPRATSTRTSRERGQVGGRTQEIQRLIGRSMRAMLDDFAFGEFTLKVDCDVLDADGGTRTASITGASVAVVDAFAWMQRTGRLTSSPVRRRVAAVSVGLLAGEGRLDLNYEEDVVADVDMNVVMTSERAFVEVQGTAEHAPFDRQQLDTMLRLAERGIEALDVAQSEALNN